MHRIAYFITPHGFGHAARASAVMNAVSDIVPSVSFDIFTTVPKWFFEDSIAGRFVHHEFWTDVGLVQKTPFSHDVKETIVALDRFIPFAAAVVSKMADVLRRRACRLVVCDIAPIGIAIAAEAGIPSVLVENFTWDWVYEDFIHADARFGRHVDFLRATYQTVDYHIQTVPLCRPQRVDMTADPISRKIRLSSERVRKALGISKAKKVILLTTGGFREKYRFLNILSGKQAVCFVVPGASETFKRQDNVILLPYHSDFFHPDLVNAADAVIGKAGYSTIAEVYQAGVPFGYVPRPNFRETDKLAAFIEKEMKGMCIDADDFLTGKWLQNVQQLLDIPRTQRPDGDGSRQAAGMIAQVLNEAHA